MYLVQPAKLRDCALCLSHDTILSKNYTKLHRKDSPRATAVFSTLAFLLNLTDALTLGLRAILDELKDLGPAKWNTKSGRICCIRLNCA